MLEFLKKLYNQRKKEITVILLDDSKPGMDDTYRIRPNSLFVILTFISIGFSIIVALAFMMTPLGGLLYTKEDADLRRQVVAVTDRVVSLQDSLEVRNTQLEDMKNIIRLSVDTTLDVDTRLANLISNRNNSDIQITDEIESMEQDNQISPAGIVYSSILSNAPQFPAPYPVEGIQSRGYEPESFHYGIDLATESNTEIESIADGTVVTASWTVNEGYIMIIQHEEGIISVYKHCSSLTKKSGDVVVKGDIIGSTGDVGITSSGAHLHFEIWKNGLPQNPAIYLIP